MIVQVYESADGYVVKAPEAYMLARGNDLVDRINRGRDGAFNAAWDSANSVADAIRQRVQADLNVWVQKQAGMVLATGG